LVERSQQGRGEGAVGLDPAGGEVGGAVPGAGADPPVGTTASQVAATAPVAELPPGKIDDG
jgi:hypothetical protein